MNNLAQTLFWLALALLMIFCCVIDVINQAWFALAVCIVGFVLDTINASVKFAVWASEQGKKDARKTEEDNDT